MYRPSDRPPVIRKNELIFKGPAEVRSCNSGSLENRQLFEIALTGAVAMLGGSIADAMLRVIFSKLFYGSAPTTNQLQVVPPPKFT
jgi:hypothetical protein